MWTPGEDGRETGRWGRVEVRVDGWGQEQKRQRGSKSRRADRADMRGAEGTRCGLMPGVADFRRHDGGESGHLLTVFLNTFQH